MSTKPKGEPVFRLRRTAEMVQSDLRRARAAWIKATPNRQERSNRRKSDLLAVEDDAGQVCDFHALRHTYITRVVASGASVKVCQELARHSTPALTIGRYAHARLADLSTALDKLPGAASTSTTSTPGLRATGTADSPPR